MFNTLNINKNALTIMDVKFTDLPTLEHTANAMASNMFEGFEPTPKGVEIIRDYIQGDITFAEMVALAKAKAYV